MAQLDDELDQLGVQVAATQGAEASAKKLIDGFAVKLKAAVDAAVAAGATPAQLQKVTDLHTALTASSTDLSASVAANP